MNKFIINKVIIRVSNGNTVPLLEILNGYDRLSYIEPIKGDNDISLRYTYENGDEITPSLLKMSNDYLKDKTPICKVNAVMQYINQQIGHFLGKYVILTETGRDEPIDLITSSSYVEFIKRSISYLFPNEEFPNYDVLFDGSKVERMPLPIPYIGVCMLPQIIHGIDRYKFMVKRNYLKGLVDKHVLDEFTLSKNNTDITDPAIRSNLEEIDRFLTYHLNNYYSDLKISEGKSVKYRADLTEDDARVFIDLENEFYPKFIKGTKNSDKK